MKGFMVDAGGEVVTREDVFSVPVPEPAKRHYPIPHSYLIGTVQDIFDYKFVNNPEFNYTLKKEQYALAGFDKKTGIPGQMFGLFTYDTGDPQFGFSVGFRNSYDQSLAAGVVGGANPFVCSNLCFSGDSFKIHRKNTLNAIHELYAMVMDNAWSMFRDYQKMVKEFGLMSRMPVSQSEGFETLGLMYGEGMIKQRQFAAAVDAWREPPQVDWAPRNALSLYNAVTEGTKKTNVADVVDDLSKTHKFFRQRFNVPEIIELEAV